MSAFKSRYDFHNRLKFSFSLSGSCCTVLKGYFNIFINFYFSGQCKVSCCQPKVENFVPEASTNEGLHGLILKTNSAFYL